MLGRASWPGRRSGLADRFLTQPQGRFEPQEWRRACCGCDSWGTHEKHDPHVWWGQNHWHPPDVIAGGSLVNLRLRGDCPLHVQPVPLALRHCLNQLSLVLWQLGVPCNAASLIHQEHSWHPAKAQDEPQFLASTSSTMVAHLRIA